MDRASAVRRMVELGMRCAALTASERALALESAPTQRLATLAA